MINIDTNTMIGLLSVGFGFVIYFFDVRRMLVELLERHEGILSKEQADDLTDVYLDVVHCRLSQALDHYARNDLRGHLEQEELDHIMNELKRAYERVVHKSVRPMVSSFRLRGNHRFDDLISKVNRKKVEEAFKLINEQLKLAMQEKRPIDEFMPTIESTMKNVNDEGKTLIRREIKRLYPRSSSR